MRNQARYRGTFMTSIDANPNVIKSDDDIVPLAIFLALEHIEGPVLLAADPVVERFDFKTTIEFSGLRIFSSTYPIDLLQSGFLHALYPWSKPKGQMICLYFTLGTTELDFDHAAIEMPSTVFLVGALIDRRFSQVIRWLPDDIINNLERTASNIVELLVSCSKTKSKGMLIQEVDLTCLKNHEQEFQLQLRELREHIKSLVLEWLKQFE